VNLTLPSPEMPLPWWQHPVLSTDRAVEYIGAANRRVFLRRMASWGVRPCSRGYWSRSKIDAAMRKLERGVAK